MILLCLLKLAPASFESFPGLLWGQVSADFGRHAQPPAGIPGCSSSVSGPPRVGLTPRSE